MDKDTVKLIRVPADTWRAVVGALERVGSRHSLDCGIYKHGAGATALPCSCHVKAARSALELARKVSAE